MAQFRKRPVVIDAFRLGHDYMPDWFMDGVTAHKVWLQRGNTMYTAERGAHDMTHAIIETLEGRVQAQHGDWVIRGVKGELYPCKPDIFALTYESAPTPPTTE